MGTRGSILGDLECGGDLDIVVDGHNVLNYDCFYTPNGRSTQPPDPADGAGTNAYPELSLRLPLLKASYPLTRQYGGWGLFLWYNYSTDCHRCQALVPSGGGMLLTYNTSAQTNTR